LDLRADLEHTVENIKYHSMHYGWQWVAPKYKDNISKPDQSGIQDMIIVLKTILKSQDKDIF